MTPQFTSWLSATVLALILVPCGPLGAQASPADELLAQARELYVEEGPAPALPVYERALALFRQEEDLLGEAITLGLIGNCYKRLGDYSRSGELLEQALEMKRELGDSLEEGKTLSHLGLLAWEQADYDAAVQYFDQAITIGRELGDAQLEGSALNNLSLVYDELGDYERSLQQYDEVLELYRRTDFPRGESDTLGNIGGVYLLLGRYREAMGYYEQALAISERLESKPSMSQDLGNLALCHLGLGEISKATERFDQALSLARQTGLEKETADWLKGKGDVFHDVGRHSEGLELYRQAMESYESAGLKRELVEALNELATIHLRLGDLASAEEYQREALDLARSIVFRRGVVASLASLGELEWRRERFEESATFLGEALDGALEIEDQNLASSCRTQLVLTLRDQGRLEDALSLASSGVEIARGLESRLHTAAALYALGNVELLAGEAIQALDHCKEGSALLTDLGEPEIAWQLAHGQGKALEELGRYEEAMAAYKEAVRLIEAVRERLREESFRSGYLEDKHQVYVDLSRLLLRLERPEEAFSYAERLRARSYLDLLAESPIPRLTAEQKRREMELRQRIRGLQQSLREETDSEFEPRRRAMALFAAELEQAEREYADFLSDLRTVDPDFAATWSLSVPEAVTIREALPAGTALVEFVVGRDQVLVFLLGPERLETHVAPLSRRDLQTKVELTRQLIQKRDNDDWRFPAASLAAALIEPLEAEGWLDAVQHLYLVPHDTLHYLPFAVLPRGPEGRVLVQDYQLTYLPSAGTLVYARAGGAAAEGLLVLAPMSSRLKHTGAEARAVAEAFPDSNKVLMGDQATESSFKALSKDFKVLHLATHSTWNRLNPLLSALQLEAGDGEDGRLEVHEVLDLRLGADLVTLSACETALGSGYFGQTPVGDDFVGLTRAFLHAGSRAVLASLWEVDDRSTLELMQSFYQYRDAQGPARALAEVQRSRLEGSASADPYQWAAFVVVGPSP
ncbi:MAG: CHAT domain-containing tetratricopeptide repeat protein [Thermoanaerobaculia bacterium]